MAEPRVPRSSVQAVRTSLDELQTRRKRRFLLRLVLSVVVLLVLVRGGNWLLVGRPVSAALGADPRTAHMVLDAHLRSYVDPTTLILNLKSAQVADTADLWTGLFVAAEALASGWEYERVLLARDGATVYILSGLNFRQLARAFSQVRNPVVVMRTVVPMLRLPGGGALPPMDARAAALPWATGGH